jgi:hypothetical protein
MKAKLSVVVLVTVLVLTVSTAVAVKPEPVGERIYVYPPSPDTFPAGVPFHIAHGWRNDPSWGVPIGLFDFQLEIEGVYLDEDFFITEPVPGGKPQAILRLWYYNFPDGMPPGEVTFIGHWLAPCQAAVDYHYYPGPCEKANEIVEPYTDPVTVTFYEE